MRSTKPHIRRKGSGQIILGEWVSFNTSRLGNWLDTPGAMILSVGDEAVRAVLDKLAERGAKARGCVGRIRIKSGPVRPLRLLPPEATLSLLFHRTITPPFGG